MNNIDERKYPLELAGKGWAIASLICTYTGIFAALFFVFGAIFLASIGTLFTLSYGYGYGYGPSLAGTTVGIILVILLSLIPLAGMVLHVIIYSKIADNINIMCGDENNHLMPFVGAYLLGFVTLGIYPIYYMYKMQTMMHENGNKYGVNISQSGGTVILWTILLAIVAGVGPIISYVIILDSHNRLVMKYNEGIPEPWDDIPIPRKKGYLRCIGGELFHASIVMNDGDTLVIGRDPKLANVVLSKDTKVSRKHCIITYRNGTFTIKDVSSNGTRVGKDKIQKNITLPIAPRTVIAVSKESKFIVAVDIDDETVCLE